MTFAPENFRTLTADNPPWKAIREMDSSPLILIKCTGEALYGRTRREKDELVGRYDQVLDLLLFAWTASYKTEIFKLTPSDLNKYYRLMGGSVEGPKQ